MSLRFDHIPQFRLLTRALLTLILVLLCTVTAKAQDHIVERGWLEDLSGQLQWPDIQLQQTHPFKGVLSKGFGRSAIWIRLRIDPVAQPASSREPERLILRMRPTYLDNIQVFDPLVPGGLAGTTGDLHHPREQGYESLDFVLPIMRGQVPRDIWLKLQSTSTRQISVQAVTPEDLNRKEHIQALLFALYLAVITVFMIWALVHWLFSRETVIGSFALTQVTAFFFALGSLGYSRVFWPAFWPGQWLDMATSTFSILAVSSAVLFHVVFISEFSPPRWMTRLLWLTLLLVLPIKLLLLLADQAMLALHLNMLEILMVPSVFLAAILLSTGWKHPEESQRPALQRWVVTGFYMLLCVILLIAVLPGLALTEGGEIPLYIVQAHGVLTAFLILLMLQYRAHVRQRYQHSMALALERSQLQAAQEKNMREELGQLLTMLTHELKTPLATMHMRLDSKSEGSREIRRAIRDMDAVIERCVQSIQLGDQQLSAQPHTIDAVKVLRDAIAACAQPDRINVKGPERLPMVTDPQLLFIVLTNLLENACKYAAPDTLIDLQIESIQLQDQLAMKLLISNQPGPAGLPDPEKVFEKYYRSPHARRQAGTGLGLFLVKHLVEVLDGTIEYLPEPSTVQFSLHLPSLGLPTDLA